ncbi:hypothetical protein RCL1_007116 [Eukaryota sp. TZLM3-RCL]
MFHPIVFVPGAAGTILKARLRSDPSQNFTVWPTLQPSSSIEKYLWMTPISEDSTYTEDLNTEYEIYIPDDDYGLFAISDLAKGLFSSTLPRFIRKYTGYFCTIIEHFESKGYKKGEHLFGCGYDWRKSLLDERSLNKLKSTIELAVKSTGLPCDVISHSLGGLLTRSFLALQDPQWVSTHVRSFIAMGTGWLGASGSVLNLLIQGYNGGVNFIPSRAFKGIQVNSSAAYACLPTDLPSPPRVFVKSETEGWLVFSPTPSSCEQHLDLEQHDRTFPPTPRSLRDNSPSPTSSIVSEKNIICDECLEASAVMKCLNCDGVLCDACYTETHSSRLLSRHKVSKLIENEAEVNETSWGQIKNSLRNMLHFGPSSTPSSTASPAVSTYKPVEIINEDDESWFSRFFGSKTDLPHPMDSAKWESSVRNINELWSLLTEPGTLEDVLFKVRKSHLKEAQRIRTLIPQFLTTKFYNIFGANLDTPYHCCFTKPVKTFSQLCKPDMTCTYSSVSGDRTIPAVSAMNHGMVCQRNIQVNDTGHVEMLHSREVVSIIDDIVS